MADDDMVAWLTACLDEIERAAQTAAATQPGGGVWEYAEAITVLPDRVEAPDGTGRVGVVAEIVSDRPGEHIALNDPRAVLARVQAERAMLERYTRSAQWARTAHPVYGSREFDENIGAVAAFTVCVRHLAHAHRFDAPGFRDEWSPDA